jgi:hypothetical protein
MREHRPFVEVGGPAFELPGVEVLAEQGRAVSRSVEMILEGRVLIETGHLFDI